MWRRWCFAVLSLGLGVAGCESVSDEICARACACGTCNIVDGHGAVLFSTEEECRSKVDEYVHNGSRWQCDADLDTAACTTTATPVKDALILPDSCGEGDWSDE